MSLLIGLSNSSHKSDHEVQLDSVAVINWLGNRGKPVQLQNFGQNLHRRATPFVDREL